MKRSQFSYTHCYCEENIYRFLEKHVLFAEIAKRSKRSPHESELHDDAATATKPEASAAPPTVPYQPTLFTTESFACFVSTFVEPDVARERKNKWESQFPICTKDVLGLLGPADEHCSFDGDPFLWWDYHVIAILQHSENKQYYIVDFDAKFPSPSQAEGAGSLLHCVRLDLYMTISFFPSAKHKNLTATDTVRASMRAKGIHFRVVPSVEFLSKFRSDRTHMLVPKKAQSGGQAYLKPPPPTPPICEASPIALKLFGTATPTDDSQEHKDASGGRTTEAANLTSFINMGNTTTVPGRVMKRDEVIAYFSKDR